MDGKEYETEGGMKAVTKFLFCSCFKLDTDFQSQDC